jgi:flagellar biogenesis protein FliO
MRNSRFARRFHWNRILFVIAFASVCLAAGPTTSPVAPTTQAAGSGRELVRSSSRVSSPTTQQGNGLTSFELDPGRLLLSLGSVLLLIFAMRFVLKKFFPHVATPKTSTAMRVLTRLPINPKQQLLLVQVGKRMVVVGDCGTSLSKISEITDPDEVVQLLGQLSEDNRSIETRSFVNLFGKARQGFDEQEVSTGEKQSLVEETPDEIEATKNELSGLISKVRDLSSQFRKQ